MESVPRVALQVQREGEGRDEVIFDLPPSRLYHPTDKRVRADPCREFVFACPERQATLRSRRTSALTKGAQGITASFSNVQTLDTSGKVAAAIQGEPTCACLKNA